MYNHNYIAISSYVSVYCISNVLTVHYLHHGSLYSPDNSRLSTYSSNSYYCSRYVLCREYNMFTQKNTLASTSIILYLICDTYKLLILYHDYYTMTPPWKLYYSNDFDIFVQLLLNNVQLVSQQYCSIVK